MSQQSRLVAQNIHVLLRPHSRRQNETTGKNRDSCNPHNGLGKIAYLPRICRAFLTKEAIPLSSGFCHEMRYKTMAKPGFLLNL
jgi:hypothetical protein